MEIFEKISDTLIQVGKDVTQKAKDVSGIAKLKMDIRAKEDFVRTQYLAIGKSYYQRHKGETLEEQAQFDRIDEALEAITKMEIQILELKGARRCQECGAQAADVAVYCSICGAKLAIVREEDEAEDAEEPQDMAEPETAAPEETGSEEEL